MQGISCALVVNSHAISGKVPEKIMLEYQQELPATVATDHAETYFDNVHPVRHLTYVGKP